MANISGNTNSYISNPSQVLQEPFFFTMTFHISVLIHYVLILQRDLSEDKIFSKVYPTFLYT